MTRDGHQTARRRLLRVTAQYGIGATVAGLGLGACSLTDPVVRPRDPGGTVQAPPTSASPTPTPLPGGSDGAMTEAKAAAWCTALAGATRYKLTSGQTKNLERAATLHRRHLEVLSTPEATTRPRPSASATATTAPPSIGKLDSDRSKGFKAFRAAMSKLEQEHLGRVGATSGMTALLWASLAASIAQSVVVAGRETSSPEPATEGDHLPYEPMTDIAAAQALLTQLHALVFGLQAALAPLSGDAATPYQDRLVRARIQRDHLVDWLRDQDADVPAAEPEYDLGGSISKSSQAYALVARMETALLPFAGDWVAAAAIELSRQAAEWLADGAGIAVLAGAAPTVWPGWRD